MKTRVVVVSCFVLVAVALAIVVVDFCTDWPGGYRLKQKDLAYIKTEFKTMQAEIDTANEKVKQVRAGLLNDLSEDELLKLVQARTQANPGMAIRLECFASEEVKKEVEKFRKEEKGQLMVRIQQLAQENERLRTAVQGIASLEKKLFFFEEKVRIAQGEDVRQTFNVVVDYGRNLGEMIESGKYNSVHGGIHRFKLSASSNGKQERRVVLFHFNETINTYDAIEKMETAGFHPAAIEDLLALGEIHPGLQLRFWIVALKSTTNTPNGSAVPVLVPHEGRKRGLSVFDFANKWPPYCRFAATQ